MAGELISETPFLNEFLESDKLIEDMIDLKDIFFSFIPSEELEKIDLLQLTAEQKKQFIKEFLNLNTEERKKFIDDMLKK